MSDENKDPGLPATGEPAASPPPGGAPPPGPGPFPAAASDMPAMSPGDRVRAAAHRRGETDYIFNYWTALGWTVLTLGIYGLCVFYQLVRRMRDHNVRRLELLDAALAAAWVEAGRRGLQEELTPSFQRAAQHVDVLRGMTRDFREPSVWVILSFFAGGIVHIVAFYLLDQDLIRHDQSEVGIEYELSGIYGRLGQQVPAPDQARVKGQDNFVGRVVASIFSFGIYFFWWFYNQMDVPNRHFEANWTQEDALVAAVGAVTR